MDKHIFISYSHKDGEFAENLIHRITQAGFKTWIDTEINVGEEWRLNIDQAIKNAFALIVIMTPEAQASEYVTYEWAFAWGAGVKVIPIILKQTELHPRIATLQHLNFTSTDLSSRPWDKLKVALNMAAETYSSPSINISASAIMEAARLIAAALDKTQNPQTIDHQIVDSAKTRESAERIDQLVTSKASKQIAGASILWVDDRPSNNIYAQRALEALGLHFTVSTSTEDALKLLFEKKYDVIISDMGRPPDKRAGYTLLEKIKARQIDTPFIIYASSRSPEHVAESRRKGAIGCTNNPQELFEMVVDAIKNA